MRNRPEAAVLADIHGREDQNMAPVADNHKFRQVELNTLKVHRSLEERRSCMANALAGEDIPHTRRAALLGTRNIQEGEDSDVCSRHIALDEVFVSTIHASAAGCGGRLQPLEQQHLVHVYVCDQHYPEPDHSPADQGIDMWKETWGLKTVITRKNVIGKSQAGNDPIKPNEAEGCSKLFPGEKQKRQVQIDMSRRGNLGELSELQAP
jgi:hypothetical protein